LRLILPGAVAIAVMQTSKAGLADADGAETAAPREAARPVMKFRIVEAGSERPLPGAKLSVPFFYAGGVSEGRTDYADAEGRIALLPPLRPGFRGFNVFCSHEGHVGKVINVNLVRGIPPEHIFRLDRGVPIGGVVLDDSQRPVEGVEVRLSTPGSRTADLEHVHYHGDPIRTDAQGLWRTARIPAQASEVRLTLVHPDFQRTPVRIEVANGVKNRTLLQRGYEIKGSVVGWDDRPIAGASVREYHNRGSSEPQAETKTDPDGNFRFANVPAGAMELVVEAPGNAPTLRNVQVIPKMEPLVFILEKGGIFRGRVIDSAGKPVAGARVLTDSDNEGRRPVFWITTTDAEGRFFWDSAPVVPTLFWFEASGYEVIRDKRLTADGTEHEIILKMGDGANSP
jgi:uncharacterized GH25 family protein